MPTVQFSADPWAFAACKFQLRSRIITRTLAAIACLGSLAVAWQLASHRQTQAAMDLQQLGGRILWTCRWDSMMQVAQTSADVPPHWLVAGDAFVSGVYLMNCNDQLLDEKLVSLESLPGIRCLSLANDCITDATISHLSRLTHLEDLSLGNTLVTDSSLRNLATLKNLKYINLSGTRVTPAGVAFLHAQVPAARIVTSFDQVVTAS